MRRFFCALIGLATLGQAARADWVGLGPAADYNEFVLGSSNRFNSDVQGRVAVGGSLVLTNMSIATKVPAGDNLLVGGNLVQTNGSVNGNAQVRGSATLTNVSTAGATYYVNDPMNSTTNNGATITSPSNLSANFFPDAGTMLVDESTYLGGLANTGGPAVVMFGNQLFFDAGNANFALFHITATQLRTAGQLNYISNSANTTFVIDVDDDGTSYGIANTGTMFSGANPSNVGHVLYNFYETNATPGNNTLSLSSVYGSVLAPLAAVSFNNGGFNGQLIAGSLDGNGESHVTYNGNPGGDPTKFVGTIPTRAVPEPGSLALVLIGSAGAAWGFRRRLRV